MGRSMVLIPTVYCVKATKLTLQEALNPLS